MFESLGRHFEVPLIVTESVGRAFPFWNRSTLAEIYLCHARSCHEILRTETLPGQVLEESRAAVYHGAGANMAGSLAWDWLWPVLQAPASNSATLLRQHTARPQLVFSTPDTERRSRRIARRHGQASELSYRLAVRRPLCPLRRPF
jgi:hypothetical protein